MLDRENRIRSIDFIKIAFANFFDAKIDGTFRDAHLRNGLIEVEEGKSGHAAEMNGNDTGLQFRAGIFVGPKFIADGHRPVQSSGAPIACATGLNGNGTV